MKKYIIGIVAVIVLFICCRFCCCQKNTIAVVDVQRVVSQSQPVIELRQDLQTKMGQLQVWINASNAEIEKAESQEKKDELTKQYQAELAQKQKAIEADYAQKLQQLDNEITKIIEAVAKKEGCKITLVKSSVAAGGIDITEKVIAKISK